MGSARPGTDMTAERYLRALKCCGYERIYMNAGTDFAPLAEAYGRAGAEAAVVYPEPVLAGHENLAIGMAHGAYLVSGQPQAVMVHVNVGTANALCGLLNAASDHVPILLTAGRTPIFEDGVPGSRKSRIHWAQEMFDQAAMLREVVKWDYELRSAAQVDDVVHRARAVSSSHPKGPVYLTLPREVLAAPAHGDERGPRRSGHEAPAAPDPEVIEELADRIARSECPVIVSTAGGADRASVPLLAALCGRFGVGFVEQQGHHLNLPSDHEMHLGFEYGPVFDEADFLLFVDCDIPWVPAEASPAVSAFVAHSGVDPLYTSYPIRSHGADLLVASTATNLYRSLLEALGSRSAEIDPGRAGRVASWAASLRRAAQAAADLEVSDSPISRAFLSDAIGTLLDGRGVIFDEYWGKPSLLRRRAPGSYFKLPPAGGLGWALPASLGAAVESPLGPTVALVGDGAYVFSNPVACHELADREGLAVLTVVYNNGRWGAVDTATRSVYPSGAWASGDGPSLSTLSPHAELHRHVEASGGYGVAVRVRADVAGALEGALRVVEREGRQAVVNVIGE